MAALVYALCAGTALLVFLLLLRGYRRSRQPFLLWSSLCFAALTLDNVSLFVDRVLFPAMDFTVYRRPIALIAIALLLYGMIWKSEK